MNSYLLDKLTLFLASLVIGMNQEGICPILILSMLITIAVSAVQFYFWEHEKILLLINFFHIFLCFICMPFCFFMPVTAYDMSDSSNRRYLFFYLLPLLRHFYLLNWMGFILILLIFSLSILLSIRRNRTEQQTSHFIDMRDTSEENKQYLQKKNKELLEKQDYEVHMATLHERNRIAREIHDNVGHMLSRSILQVGALLVTNKNETEHKALIDLRDTLNTAMTSIRESVHDLHDESIDLDSEIKQLLEHFTLCPVQYTYQIHSELSRKIKYSLLAIIKEALSNILNHSNATDVTLYLQEHPGLYQLLIHDNGTNISISSEGGIGLNNISDRVTGMNGTLNIDKTNGYRIFISIPKERIEKNESDNY